MARLSEQLDRVVRELRAGAQAAGGEALTELIGSLSAQLGAPGSRLSVEALLPVLEVVLDAQERTDYVALADALEYELKPRLG